MKRVCFCTYVYDNYQDYIPIHIYSILKHFPQHYVKILLHEKLKDYNHQALDLIRKSHPNSFEVKEEYNEVKCKLMNNYIHSSKKQHDNYVYAGYRFLLPKKEFDGFEYAYLGDVDVFTINEFDDNFYETYVNHTKKTGLPFSNEWNFDWGKYRITGLHFIVVEPYYAVMESLIEEAKLENKFMKWILPSYCFDEELLYGMIKDAFDIRKLKGYRRPIHGVHMGEFRVRPHGHSWAGFDFSLWNKNADKLKNLVNDEIYKELRGMVVEKKVNKTIDLFEQYLKGNFKIF